MIHAITNDWVDIFLSLSPRPASGGSQYPPVCGQVLPDGAPVTRGWPDQICFIRGK